MEVNPPIDDVMGEKVVFGAVGIDRLDGSEGVKDSKVSFNEAPITAGAEFSFPVTSGAEDECFDAVS